MKTVYPWQSKQWQFLSDLLLSGRLPHALLLHGEPHIGKFRCAEVLAETLLCSTEMDSACGFCKQCELSKSGFHPDLTIIEPEGPANNIKIESIRQLIQFLSKTSLQGGWKVAIINQADRLNINAANALLKSLEEPSPTTLLILVCSDLSRMMATVKSRCRQVAFPLPARSESKNWLSEVTSSKDVEQLLNAASGRPLLALKLLSEGSDKKFFELRELWASVANGSASAIDCAEVCSQIEGERALDWLYFYIKQLIEVSSGSVARRMYFRFIDRLLEAKRLLQGSSNPNKQLLWEELLLDLRASSR